VNGHLLGDHEGMFGGPVCDVTDLLCTDGDNEIIVEVKACNFGWKDTFDFWNRQGVNSQIVPWNLARDTATSSGDFIVMGIWNQVRLELVDPLHISRPYLYTKTADEERATLCLELEIADGTLPELHEDYCYDRANYTRAFDNGIKRAVTDRNVRIVTEITESDTGNQVYRSEDVEPLTDFEGLRMNDIYHELQYFNKTIELERPRLWYPTGLGEPYLYDVRISLHDGDRLCDTHEFQTGIRTVENRFTTGKKYRSRWEKFIFAVNGRSFFLKGMNWTPIDFLLKLDPAEYEWCLTLVKNAGIQLLRVWNGGGIPEIDLFYQLCDKLGILVWQDEFLANVDDTRCFPQRILESQAAYNLYRIRNHASLTLICGGNEINPYMEGNAASMFVEERVTRNLVPHAIYHYTTADKGSAHIYRDIEPVWFRHDYGDLPFLAESGIHSFPTYKTWNNLLSSEEMDKPLCPLTSENFAKEFPQLLNHFSEYSPDRVPRLLSRASQILNVDGAPLADLCEASQVQAYEFYTIMIEAMRENYPRCAGVMPWVFKRPWTTVGVQLVDGSGQPGLPYYAIQKTYRPIHIAWDMNWSVIAPHESLPLDVTLFCEGSDSLIGTQIRLTVYHPDLTVQRQEELTVTDTARRYSFGTFTPDDGYTDTCFLVSVQLLRNGSSLADSTYFIKCTSALADKELYEKYRSAATANLYFDKGPWLKPCVQQAKQTTVTATLLKTGVTGDYRYYDIRLENHSCVPAYPVTVQVDTQGVRSFASDNFFLLDGRECRTVRITTDRAESVDLSQVTVSAWNAPTVCVEGEI
jgi:beta-mannosidase